MVAYPPNKIENIVAMKSFAGIQSVQYLSYCLPQVKVAELAVQCFEEPSKLLLVEVLRKAWLIG
jgi:hypothetical protein